MSVYKNNYSILSMSWQLMKAGIVCHTERCGFVRMALNISV